MERITFKCCACGNAGIIGSVALSLTYVVLEGVCIPCCRAFRRTIDLLELDARLKEESVQPVRKTATGENAEPFDRLSRNLISIRPEAA